MRLILILVGIAIVVAGVGYAATSLDLVGMIASAHAPPQH